MKGKLALDSVETGKRVVGDLEAVVANLAASAQSDREAAIAEATAASAVARDDLVRLTHDEKDVLAGHIKMLIHESDKQQLHIASTINEMAAKSQATAGTANALLDFGIAHNVVSREVRDTCPTTVLHTSAGSSCEVSSALSVAAGIRKPRRNGRANRTRRGGPSRRPPPSAGSAPG